MFVIIPPQTTGEWLAWASAIITIVFGLICLLAPRFAFRLLRLQTRPDAPEAVSESRATMAGFYLGTAIVAILFNQVFIWMALGAAWIFTALGRLLSIVVDRGNTKFNWISVIVELLLGLAPLAYALGYIR